MLIMKNTSHLLTLTLSLSLLVILLGGCQKTIATEPVMPVAPAETSQQSRDAQKDIIEFDGHVVFNSFEGGFWGLVSDEGKHYNPNGLPSLFRTDGLRIHARVIPQTGMMSFRMWGTIVKLVEIKKIEGSK